MRPRSTSTDLVAALGRLAVGGQDLHRAVAAHDQPLPVAGHRHLVDGVHERVDLAGAQVEVLELGLGVLVGVDPPLPELAGRWVLEPHQPLAWWPPARTGARPPRAGRRGARPALPCRPRPSPGPVRGTGIVVADGHGPPAPARAASGWPPPGAGGRDGWRRGSRGRSAPGRTRGRTPVETGMPGSGRRASTPARCRRSESAWPPPPSRSPPRNRRIWRKWPTLSGSLAPACDQASHLESGDHDRCCGASSGERSISRVSPDSTLVRRTAPSAPAVATHAPSGEAARSSTTQSSPAASRRDSPPATGDSSRPSTPPASLTHTTFSPPRGAASRARTAPAGCQHARRPISVGKPHRGPPHDDGAAPAGAVRRNPAHGAGRVERVGHPPSPGGREPHLQGPGLRVRGQAVEEPQVAGAAVDEAPTVRAGRAGVGVRMVAVASQVAAVRQDRVDVAPAFVVRKEHHPVRPPLRVLQLAVDARAATGGTRRPPRSRSSQPCRPGSASTRSPGPCSGPPR